MTGGSACGLKDAAARISRPLRIVGGGRSEMPATLKDIAKRTNLSLGTVSNYINGKKIKEKNRVLIERAIRELDYSVNQLARGLKTNRSASVGIIMPTLDDPYAQKSHPILRAYSARTIMQYLSASRLPPKTKRRSCGSWCKSRWRALSLSRSRKTPRSTARSTKRKSRIY